MDSDTESLASTMDLETGERLTSIITDITFLVSSTDLGPEVASILSYDIKLGEEILSRKPKMELVSFLRKARNIQYSDEQELVNLVFQIISLVCLMDLDWHQLKVESEVISLIKQIITLFNSKPDLESELVSLITQTMHLGSSVDLDLDLDSDSTQESKLMSLISQLVFLKEKSELTSLIRHVISCFKSMDWEPRKFLSLCPQLHASTRNVRKVEKKGECNIDAADIWKFARKEIFYCRDCNGEFHEEYEKPTLEVKHPLHPKHSLQLGLDNDPEGDRKCYCCDEDLSDVFYYCQDCDYAMDIFCVEQPLPLLSKDHPKWHEHTLALFPSQASFPCNLCALTHSSCPFYICPPCDFVVHQTCLSLPHVIKISRHTHRISFTPSFNKGEWFCGVCRKKINNDYGGYSCIKKGCSYAAHSKCATQSNVWDGEDLEGVPEETEEEWEPFVRIGPGVIQHFSHQHNNLRLDENTGRDYDENKLCQACITPFYFGNFYSCMGMGCEFIIHETCSNLPYKLHYPIHRHPLSLVITNIDSGEIRTDRGCAVCPRLCTGLFYKCIERKCYDEFKLHVQCATISEPLVHESHMHPLFLTSKPQERRICGICKGPNETFNCIECDFSLCFGCATIPHEVRYKHDKHMLTLSYGNEASILEHWCEACERKIDLKERFYKCDEYCCVTIHVECLIGKDFYMKPGSSLINYDYPTNERINVLPQSYMSRPICFKCKMRCPQKVVFEYYGLIFCSVVCAESVVKRRIIF